jgi:AcrR family transcriptional regulator
MSVLHTLAYGEGVAAGLAAVNTPPYGQAMGERLGRQEWITAGLRAMAGHGVEAVRVERLAAALGVTKGSFYWHFKDRDALLAALLEAWKARATNDIITRVEAAGDDAETRLHTLFAIAARADGRLDRAIRLWAGQDPKVRLALEQADRRRLSYLEALFRGLGFAPAEAAARARLAYYALIGQFTLGAPARPRKASTDWLDVIYPLLVRRP